MLKMARHGVKKQQKRIAVPKIMHVHRKANTWITKTSPGPRNKERSVPLGVVLKEQLKSAENEREVKYMLNNRKVLVDGTIRKSPQFPVGVLDVITLTDSKTSYRLVFDSKARLVPKQVTKATDKICRIEKKIAAKNKKVQLHLSDGRNILVDEKEKDKYNVLDGIHIEIPSQKIIASLKYDKGSLAYITKGRHTGERGEITEITPSNQLRQETVKIKGTNYDFETTASNLMVIGTKKEAIEV